MKVTDVPDIKNGASTRVAAVVYDTRGSIDEESRLIDVLRAENIPVAVCSVTSESLRLLNGRSMTAAFSTKSLEGS